MMIVKVGGGNGINLAGIAADLAASDEPAVVLLGANGARNALAQALDQPIRSVTSVSGYSSVLSDQHTIDLMMMAYAGLRAKSFVTLLQQNGVNGLSLSGVDGALVTARRNRGIKVMQDGKKMMLHDLSGKPEAINTRLLQLLLHEGYTPVITVPVLDEKGVAVNTENDEIAVLLQRALDAEKVVHLIEAAGLCRDPAFPESLVHRLYAEDLIEWEQEVSGRMRRKIYALRKLFDGARPTVYLADGRGEHPLQAALEGTGTVIS